MKELELEVAQENLEYNPETGVLLRKVNRGRGRAGTEAGSVNNWGYRNVPIRGGIYKAHRVAWLLHYGVMPSGMIDHINGNRDDNRIENLRDCDMSTNALNRKRQWNWAKSTPP